MGLQDINTMLFDELKETALSNQRPSPGNAYPGVRGYQFFTDQGYSARLNPE
jgi:hypothetical protein